MRLLFALFLTLAQALAPAVPALAQAGEVVVLCSDDGVISVTLPDGDNPGSGRLIGQHCPDCATPAAAIPPMQVAAPALAWRVSRAEPPLDEMSLPQPAPFAPLARGPPARKS